MESTALPALCAASLLVAHDPVNTTAVLVCSKRVIVAGGSGTVTVVAGGADVTGAVVGDGAGVATGTAADAVIASNASTHTQDPPDAALLVPVT